MQELRPMWCLDMIYNQSSIISIGQYFFSAQIATPSVPSSKYL